MRENLSILDQGSMTDTELAHMRRIGDFIHRGK
jgi:hypothetical protein